ncbi:MAG: hypothetical protein KF700_02105 [Hyphomonadaceae bacterium]|nr:hypothetical protein [Hyphomonadaceae bacterium]
MNGPPVPQRIPPLTWRRPSLVFTPIALALAIGWPLMLLQNAPDMLKFALLAGGSVFALALLTMGVAWAGGRAPRTRREVVGHVVAAGAVVALVGPFALTRILAAVADYDQAGSGAAFNIGMAAAVTPLALVIGLPVALVSGLVFASIALMRPASAEPDERADVQPFR